MGIYMLRGFCKNRLPQKLIFIMTRREPQSFSLRRFFIAEDETNYPNDLRMVLEVLDFTFNSLGPYSNNIVQYTIHQIKERKIADVFNELIGIHAIGNKLASFYLRDVIIIYQLEKLLKPDEFRYCQPIDTWVKQVALKIGIITQKDEDIEDTKNAIIKTCLDAGVSPLLFNAGMWMVGAQSFE